LRFGGQNKLLGGQDVCFHYGNKLFWAQQNLGGTKKLGTLPLNVPTAMGLKQSKVSSKFQQICRLLTVEIVVSEHIFVLGSQ